MNESGWLRCFSSSVVAVAVVGWLSACSSEVVGGEPAGELEAGLCDGFGNEPEAPSEVVVENASEETLYVAEYLPEGPVPLFDVLDPSTGEPLPLGWPACSCESMQEDTWYCTHSFGGPSYAVIVIPPGTSHAFEWDGRMKQPEDMPDACYAGDGSGWDTCDRRVLPEAGTYPVRIEAHLGVTGCWNGAEDGACNCEGDTSCQLSAWSLESTATVTLEGSMDVGGSDRAQLVYGG